MKMKPLGIVRRMDDLGRVVVPKEVRRTLEIKEGDALELFATDKGVYLQKYDPNDETAPDIFKEKEPAVMPAQPPVKTESRKNLIVHDKNSDQDYYVRLTDDQIKLLDYLMNEYIIDGNYEVIENHTFQTI